MKTSLAHYVPTGCTVLYQVPLTPDHPYFASELFPDIESKVNANQDRYNRDLGQSKSFKYQACHIERFI